MRTLNVTQFIEESKFNRFHYLLLFWGSLLIVFDGYDLSSFGAIVPTLMKEWSLSPLQVGAFNTYTVIGMMLGALGFGILADKIGRKNVTLVCIAFYSIFTALTALSSGPADFSIYRFLTGLGLGGIMPNLIALMMDYSPKSKRSILAPLMFCGMSVGAILAALVSILLIPSLGWRWVFVMGVLPLAIIPFLIKSLPESPNLLLAKGRHDELIKIINKIDPAGMYTKDDRFEVTRTETSSFPIFSLFKNGRALGTILFWIVYPMIFVMTFGLATWLPQLMLKAGYSLGSSLSTLMVLNLGGILGTIVGGRLADKIALRRVLVLYFVIGALGYFCLGFKSDMLILYVLLLISGACTLGTQNLLHSFVAQFYPIEMRATGTGTAIAIGRFGAMAGPLLGGMLLTMNMPIQINFLIFGIPGIIAAAGIWFVRERYVASLSVKSISRMDESVNSQ